jgi:hypothetical protein
VQLKSIDKMIIQKKPIKQIKFESILIASLKFTSQEGAEYEKIPETIIFHPDPNRNLETFRSTIYQ